MESKPKILLLEDDSDMRSLLERILSYQDYDVTSVDTGFAAIEAVKTTHFDLIVADVRVDGPDGIEVLSEAKKDRPDVGTLAVSGYSSLEDDARAERLGVGGFLRKPFETQRFLELVQQQLHKRAKKRKERNLEQEVASVYLTTLNTLFQAYGATPQAEQVERIGRAREMAMKLGIASGLEGLVLQQVAAAAALAVMPARVVGELCKTLTEMTPIVDSLSEALHYYEWPNDHDPRPPLEARIVRLVKAVVEGAELDGAGMDKELVGFLRSEESLPQVGSAPKAGAPRQSESFLAIAQTLERAGDIQGANAAYKELLESKPESEAGGGAAGPGAAGGPMQRQRQGPSVGRPGHPDRRFGGPLPLLSYRLLRRTAAAPGGRRGRQEAAAPSCPFTFEVRLR
jgi:CheY-like chemotaxis protein